MEFWGGLAFTYLPLKRFYKYILKRLVGSFLRHDIDLEQLEVQLYRGIVQLKELDLDVSQFNMAAVSAGLFMHFVSGCVGTIKMDVPWRHLLGDHCKIYLDGVHLVLAKGPPPDPVPFSPLEGGSAETAALPGAPQVPSAREPLGPGRYSDEGIRTLSRLVKHVLSRTEACFHDISVSLQVPSSSPISGDVKVLAPETVDLLRARVSSVVVFSEQASSGSEASPDQARAVRVLGVNLSLVRPGGSLGLGGGGAPGSEVAPQEASSSGSLVSAISSEGREECEIVLLSTDGPAGAKSAPGELNFRCCQAETADGQAGLGGPGNLLDLELFIPSLRVALAPAAYGILAQCLALLQGRPDTEEIGGVLSSAATPLVSHRPPAMVQSLMESSITGGVGQAGFWHELYNLFEADSQLEDAAGRGDDSAEGWDDPMEAEDRGLGASALDGSDAGPSDEGGSGPLVGYTLRMNIMRVGVVLVLSNDTTQQFGPQDVRLSPGPAAGVCADQVQLCVEKWEVVVTQRLPPPSGDSTTRTPVHPSPTAVVLVRTVAVHLHQHRPHQCPTTCNLAAATDASLPPAAPSAGAALDATLIAAIEASGDFDDNLSALPAVSPLASSSMALDFDPMMFCSAMSSSPAMAGTASAAIVPSPRLEGELERQSSHGSTAESFGGSEDSDSCLRSAASSLHSFDSVSNPGSPKRRLADGSLADLGASGSTPMGSGIGAVPPSIPTMAAHPAGQDAEPRSAWGPGEVQSDGESEEADEPKYAGDTPFSTNEDLEALFFDRSQPIHNVLLDERRLASSTDPMDDDRLITSSTVTCGADDGEACANGWCRIAGGFHSKRVLHLLGLTGPLDESTINGELCQPMLTLLPAEHPLWGGLHLSGRGPAALALTSGYQIRVELGEDLQHDIASLGATAAAYSPSRASLCVESRPVVVSLCCESVHILTRGGSRLAGLVASHSVARRHRQPEPPVLPDVQRMAFFTAGVVTPLIRVVLDLGTSEQGSCSVVNDFVAPRLFTRPVGNTGQESSYTEFLHVELADVAAYLLASNVPAAGEAGSSAASSSRCPPALCKSILSIDGGGEDYSAKGRLSFFQRCIFNNSQPADLEREQVELGKAVPAADIVAPPLSEWTKISEAEGRHSKSSLMLQDLRDASQRLMRPSHSMRSSAAATPSAPFPHRRSGLHVASGGAARAEASPGDAGPASDATGFLTASEADVVGTKTAQDSGGGEASTVGDLACEGQMEVEFSLPRAVQLHFDAETFKLLREACGNFANRSALLQIGDSIGLQTLPLPVDGDVDEQLSSPSLLGVNVSIGSVRFELLEEDPQQHLQFHISPVQCRLLHNSRSPFKFCALGQDLRLEALNSLRSIPEQLVRPWFRPLLFVPQSGTGAGAADAPAFAAGSNFTMSAPRSGLVGYPWEALPVGHCTSVVSPIFASVDRGQWQETHSFLFKVDPQRAVSGDHLKLSVKVNRLVFNAHPHINQIYSRLMLFCNPAECSTNVTTPDFRAAVPTCAPTSFNTWEVSALDCLVDVPSEAYNQLWPITSPNGLHVPTPQPRTRGLDGDKWRAIAHIGGFEVSLGMLQSVTAQQVMMCASECNVFLVDHPSHLSSLDLLSSSSQPQVFLSSFGFAHILELSGATAVWQRQTVTTDRGGHTVNSTGDVTSRPFSRSQQSLDVSVGNFSGHVCADTVKCILCMGMELGENFITSYSLPLQSAPSGGGNSSAQAHSLHSLLEAPRIHHATTGSAQQLRVPGAVARGKNPKGLNVFANIDMFAFDAPSPSFTPSPRSARSSEPEATVVLPIQTSRLTPEQSSLEACVIEDYIRTQQSQQANYSPIHMHEPDPSLAVGLSPIELEDAELFDIGDWAASVNALDATSAPADPMSSSSVAVCLLDPAAYSQERLRHLCLQDSKARREVERMFTEEASPQRQEIEVSAPAAPQEERDILRQGGNTAVWLIDPEELDVVQDHFSRRLKQPSPGTAKLQPLIHSHPVELAATFCCDLMQVTLYGGTDFADDAQSKVHPRTAAPEVKTTHLTLQLQGGVAKLMDFDVVSAGSSLSYSHSDVLKRQLIVRARDICILDRVQSSVFSHLLSYYEDEYHRPRQNNADMLHLRLDEMLQHATLGVMTPEGSDVPEYRVDLRLLPLRLTVDQDVVDFLMDFVQLCTLPGYVEEDSGSPWDSPHGGAGGASSSDVADIILTVEADGIGGPTFESEDAGLFFDAIAEADEPNAAALVESVATAPSGQDSADTFKTSTQSRAIKFQHISISALLVSVDYRAKRLDVAALRRGELWELMNLLPLLEGLEVAFRRVTISGADGLGEVLAKLVKAWSADLNRTQILKSLTGVTPIRSFANIGGGFADMVLEPLKQYRAGKSPQRVSSALLQGLVSFLKHVTVESIDLTERIFVGTQSALEYVNACLQEPQEGSALPARQAAAASSSAAASDAARMGLLEGLGSPDAVASTGALAISQNWTPVDRGAGDYLQPGSASEGLEQASANLTRGIRQAGQAVVGRPLLELQRGASKEKVLQSIVSGIPVCVLRPAIGATAAAATALRGLRNSVDPVRRREGERKYKEPE